MLANVTSFKPIKGSHIAAHGRKSVGWRGSFELWRRGGIQITVKKAHFQALSEHRATRLPFTGKSLLRLPVSGNQATANCLRSASSILPAEGQILRI